MYKTFRYEEWGDLNLHIKKVNKYVSPLHTVTTLQNYNKHKRGMPPPPPTTKQHRLGFS